MKYLDIEQVAKLCGWTNRHARRMCQTSKLAGAVKKGGQWEVPETADARLTGKGTPEQIIKISDLNIISLHKIHKATVRLGIIKECEKFTATVPAAGMNHTEAVSQFAAYSGMGARTLRRWIAKYKAKGLVGLVDTRGGRPKKIQPTDEAPRTRKPKQSRRDPVAGTCTGLPVKETKKRGPKAETCVGSCFD